MRESWEYESDTDDFISNGYTLEVQEEKEVRVREMMGDLMADLGGLSPKDLASGVAPFADREREELEEKRMTANEKKMGSRKNQKELMQDSEYKPITIDELADNEYLDIHSG